MGWYTNFNHIWKTLKTNSFAYLSYLQNIHFKHENTARTVLPTRPVYKHPYKILYLHNGKRASPNICTIYVK